MRYIAHDLTVSFFILFVCSTTWGAIPGADDPKAYTEHHYRKSLLEFNRRTLSEAYKQVGKRDPKWVQDAIKFLDGIALRFSNARVAWQYELPDMPDLQTLG